MRTSNGIFSPALILSIASDVWNIVRVCPHLFWSRCRLRWSRIFHHNWCRNLDDAKPQDNRCRGWNVYTRRLQSVSYQWHSWKQRIQHTYDTSGWVYHGTLVGPYFWCTSQVAEWQISCMDTPRDASLHTFANKTLNQFFLPDNSSVYRISCCDDRYDHRVT